MNQNNMNQQWPPQYNPYQGYNQGYQVPQQTASMSAVMRQVYLKMTLALIVSGLVAFFFSQSQMIYSMSSGMMIGLVVVEIVLVLAISAGINKLSSPVATLLFFLFAVVNGLMLAPIFIVYTGVSIAKTFFITAGTFGAMSVFGYTTKQDLSKMGSILFMALIGLIIVSVVNMFMHSDTLDWIISAAGVLIFVGLTAWDTQWIKRLIMSSPSSTAGRIATLGALNLYLDFINLFLYLLRFFGNRD